VSNFSFLTPEFPHLYDHALAVEKQVMADPRSACFRARHALEMAVHWLYEHDRTLRTPYDTKLDALLHEPSFKAMVPMEPIGTRLKPRLKPSTPRDLLQLRVPTQLSAKFKKPYAQYRRAFSGAAVLKAKCIERKVGVALLS
jgi:Domain of unknown function (DUF4145)